MHNYCQQLVTPIAFFVFRRPQTTKKVFDVIRQIKPKKLFLIADGPRINNQDDFQKCSEVRKIIDNIDWNCQVLRNFSETNMGLKKRFSSGLDWVFDNVEKAIILEDDCLPDLSFFQFCEELLNLYEDDKRVFSITGHNHLGNWKSGVQSYHFSYYFNCWGWATWKRVWDLYDADMKAWSEKQVKESVRDVIADKRQFFNRAKLLDLTYTGKINTWDYQFFFLCLMQSGFTITPSTNLISNIGFGEDATNTVNEKDNRIIYEVNPLTFPIKHPLAMAVDREYDYRRYRKVWAQKGWKKLIPKPFSIEPKK